MNSGTCGIGMEIAGAGKSDIFWHLVTIFGTPGERKTKRVKTPECKLNPKTGDLVEEKKKQLHGAGQQTVSKSNTSLKQGW